MADDTQHSSASPRRRPPFARTLTVVVLAVVGLFVLREGCSRCLGNRRIKFRGLLLDQFGDPVPDARIAFGMEAQVPAFVALFGLWQGPFTATTDRRGRFRVNVLGKAVWADGVHKTGYSSEGMIGATRESHPDRLDYFYVWRHFPADVLATGQAHIGGTPDGTVHTFYHGWDPYDLVLPASDLPNYVSGAKGYDYRQGAVEDGDLWVSVVLSADEGGAVLKIAVPNGGVQLRPDWDCVIAPAEGYRDELEITVPVGRNIAVQRIFTEKRRGKGGSTYATYEFWNGSVSPGQGADAPRFCFRLDQRTNPYGSRDLASGDPAVNFAHDELAAATDLQANLDKLYAEQGNRAAQEYRDNWQKEETERRARQHRERQERSEQILPDVLELERRRLEYRPIMKAVLAGSPHPPWPRAGIKASRR